MLALPRWDGLYSSTAFSLARELSKKNRVFYIDNPFTIKDVAVGFRAPRVRKRMKALLFGDELCTNLGDATHNLVAVTPPVTLPINFLPEGNMYEWFSRVNDKIFFSAVKKIIDRFLIRDFIFINVFNPFYGRHFPKFFKPRLFIYYSVDNIGHSLYVQKHGPRLENAIIKKANLALTTSKDLLNTAIKKTDRAYYLPNAADVSLFTRKPGGRGPVPEEFKSIKTPIIIFTGHIDVRVDDGLLVSILENHPDKTLVMLGPHSLSREKYDKLAAYPNMLFLGRRDLAELPAYLYHAHCAIIPFKCDELTKSIYPLKVNEYLAAGLPVVSTPFSEDIEGFRDVIHISDSNIDFCYKISEAIDSDKEQTRKAREKVASGNNWENRASRFWEIVNDHVAAHSNSIAPMS